MKTSHSMNPTSTRLMMAGASTRPVWTNLRACLRGSSHKNNHWPRTSLASLWASSSRRSRRLSSKLLPRGLRSQKTEPNRSWPVKHRCARPLQPSFTAMMRNLTPLRNKKNILLRSAASRDTATTAKSILGSPMRQLRAEQPLSAEPTLPWLRVSTYNS